jgi:hypothetical protein
MLGALVMRASDSGCVITTPRFIGAMHGARHDGNSSAAQRRRPRCEENSEQISSEKSTHHAANLQLANSFRFEP